MEDTPGDQSNSMSDSNRPGGRFAGGTTNQISPSNYSGAKTIIVYENDESVEIKEEIIDDQERRPDGDSNLLSENNQLDEECISSDNKSAVKTRIVYEYDETLEIKEEITQDQETTSGHKIDKRYESTLNTVDTREADILSTNNLQRHKKKKIQDSKTKSKIKYKCQKCARSYEYKHGLNTHQKFECGIAPQFICKFCDKSFTRKGSMSRHVGRMHQNSNSNQKKRKIQGPKQESEKNHNIYRHQKTDSNISQAIYKCDKCFRTYNSLGALRRHERLKHAVVKPQFVCDICGHKSDMKYSLLQHISSRHLKTSHKCDKCSRIYSLLCTLKRHDRLEHAAVKPQFICDVCSYKTNRKHDLSKHISSRHCDK